MRVGCGIKISISNSINENMKIYIVPELHKDLNSYHGYCLTMIRPIPKIAPNSTHLQNRKS